MLRLPLQKKWWLMIYNREKPEEYREIGPYWEKRFKTIGLLDKDGKPTGDVADVILVNGYREKAPELQARVTLKIRTGEKKWGAEPGREYYVLPILKQERVR